MGHIAVTGSVAYDTIMVFPGHFSEHILPGKTHMLNVSFLVNTLEKRRGGTAANIAYTLALLGERPLLCAAVGSDFGEYRRELEAAGVDTSAALDCVDVASANCFITTDLDDNQITAFFPGAMSRASGIDLATLDDVDHVVVAPDDPAAMAAHVAQAAATGARLVFAPAQQLPALSDEALNAGLEAAWLIVGNDYELELIRSRTGRDAAVLAGGAIVAVTKGGRGSEIHHDGRVIEVPVAGATEVVDPTGAGDAYIAGLLAGLRRGLDLGDAGRMGALAATYAVESQGTQTHTYTGEAFATRFAEAFGAALA